MSVASPGHRSEGTNQLMRYQLGSYQPYASDVSTRRANRGILQRSEEKAKLTSVSLTVKGPLTCDLSPVGFVA